MKTEVEKMADRIAEDYGKKLEKGDFEATLVSIHLESQAFYKINVELSFPKTNYPHFYADLYLNESLKEIVFLGAMILPKTTNRDIIHSNIVRKTAQKILGLLEVEKNNIPTEIERRKATINQTERYLNLKWKP
jgi:hypothetical protein